MLWVRGFRDHTISGRGFNLFKPLRRHFRATPFLPSGPLARRSRRRKRLGRAQCERRLRRRVRPDVGRSWKARTWRFPVSRMTTKSSSTKSGVSETEILKFRNAQMPPMGWRRWVRRDSAHPRNDRCGRLGDYRDTLPYHETQLAMPTVRQKAYGVE